MKTVSEIFAQILKENGFQDFKPYEMSNSDCWMCTALAMERYAKEYAKEELQDLLDSGCYSEYLPQKIAEAILNIDNKLIL